MKKALSTAALIQANAERWYIGERVDATMQGVYAKFLAEVVFPALDVAASNKPARKRKKR